MTSPGAEGPWTIKVCPHGFHVTPQPNGWWKHEGPGARSCNQEDGIHNVEVVDRRAADGFDAGYAQAIEDVGGWLDVRAGFQASSRSEVVLLSALADFKLRFSGKQGS